MILYHGTNEDFDSIDLEKSQVGKDFGCGFYLSDDKEQAVELATYRQLIFGGEVVVQEYEIEDNFLLNPLIKSLIFNCYDEAWADFILLNRANRKRENVYNYDVVYGPIANDKVGRQVRFLMESDIDKQTFLDRIKYMKGETFQYFFATEKALTLLNRKK